MHHKWGWAVSGTGSEWFLSVILVRVQFQDGEKNLGPVPVSGSVQVRHLGFDMKTHV